MSTLSVVERILRETGRPMSVRDIVEYSKGTLPTKSKTPDTVVARDLSMDIKKKGEGSIFIRTSPGRYTMRCLVQQDANANAETAGTGNGLAEGTQPTSAPEAGPGAPAPTSILSSTIGGDRAGTLPAEPKHSPASDAGGDSVSQSSMR